jgi:hypothetical protein
MPWGGSRLRAGRPRGSRRSDGPNRRPPRAPRPLQPREILGVARPSGALPAAARRERAAAYAEVVHLGRTFSLRSVERLGELVESEDERVAVVACQAILDRAYSKVGQAETPPTERDELEAMTPEQRRAEIQALVDKARGVLAEGGPIIDGEATEGGE